MRKAEIISFFGKGSTGITMNYSKCIAVTNRKLCKKDFIEQLARISRLGINAIILREKDLTDYEYKKLAANVMEICKNNGIKLYINSYVEVARELGCKNVHVSYSFLEEHRELLKEFHDVSVACHSIDEVKTCTALGVSQIVLGTIFETECKKGLMGKGLDFVKEASIVAEPSKIPLYVIGGIKPENLEDCIEAGASGGCLMSWFMEY